MNLRLRSVPFAATVVAAVALLGSAWKSVALWNERTPSPAPAPHAPETIPAVSGILPVDAPVPSTAAASGLTRHQLQTAMAEDRASLDQSEASIATLCTKLGIQPNEDIVSLGRYEDLAADGLKFLSAVAKFQQFAQNPAARTKNDGNEAEDMSIMVGWLAKSSVIGRLEDDPGKIARLQAAALREALNLDASEQRRVQSSISDEFQRLQASGLTRPHRPDGENQEWYEARRVALQEAAARIESLLPAEKRKAFVVEQVLHFGSGMRTRTSFDPATQKGSLNMSYELPGMVPYRL
jgi:hypothetical protein